MIYDNRTPYKGNIETSQREIKPRGAILKYGVNELDFDALDGVIEISPARFIPVDVAYDYISISRKPLRLVNAYKIQWVIKFNFISKQTLYKIKQFEEFWERSGHIFSSTGVKFNKKVYFTPEGEDGTVPTFEVVKISSFNLEPDYYEGRLIGHTNIEWTLQTVEEFKNKRMRVKVTPDLIIPASGSLTWGGSVSIGREI